MKILQFKTRRFWLVLAVATASVAPLQSVRGAEPPVGQGVTSYLKRVTHDLERVAYLTDAVSRKIENQNASVCAGGRELDQLAVALNKMNSDYNKLAHRVTVEAPLLLERAHEASQSATQMLSFFKQADLKRSCRAAAKGNSGKALAHMSITLQVTQKDVVSQRELAAELTLEADQSAYAAAQPQ